MNTDPCNELYPALDGEQLNVARENLDLYLELAWEIREDEHQMSPVDGQVNEP